MVEGNEMNTSEQAEEYAAIINQRLDQLNKVIEVVLRNMRREVSDEVALHEIQMLLVEENH